uniref:Uncharacterized protein n=1 Tax=Panagrolaimus sp. JU765 TaxID=591449 RepID=A0AC34QWK5_9BILA
MLNKKNMIGNFISTKIFITFFYSPSSFSTKKIITDTPYKDRHGFNITKGCSERKEEGCFKENDGSVSCYCYGHKCNAPTYAVKCYEFRFNDVKLIDCPNPSKQCYYVRDPTTMKTIDGGCDLQVGNKPKCSGDGCNYPMSCYDYKTDSVIQCSDSVRTCQVIYAR